MTASNDIGSQPGMPALAVQNLYKIYKQGDIEAVALRDANLVVQPGEFVAVTGRSGAGKSTLLNLLGGLSTPTAGRIAIHGTDVTRLAEKERSSFRRAHIGIVYQADNLIPFLTAVENVSLPMQLAGRRNAPRRAGQLLDEMGLGARLRHRPSMLSGGERQRVAIAVALANEPDILLADELTGELDSANAERIMALLDELNAARHLTLIIVTHNQSVAARARRQVRISGGRLIEGDDKHV
jgi:putative ABC transport system ATP-binding protein